MVGVVLVHRKNILGNLARRQSYAFVTLAHHLVIWNGRPGESCSKCISTIEVVWLLQVYFGFCAGSWACPSSLSFLYSNRTGGKWKQIWCFLSSGDLHHIIKHHQTLNTQNRGGHTSWFPWKCLKLWIWWDFATNQLTGGAICWWFVGWAPRSGTCHYRVLPSLRYWSQWH